MVEDTAYHTALDRQPPVPQVNPITTRAQWEAQRRAAEENLGAFHGAIAKRRGGEALRAGEPGW
jgi:hypothetical protein